MRVPVDTISTTEIPMLTMLEVSKAFGNGKHRHFAVRDLSLNVYMGEFLALIGSSGSGKTTTLKMINRLIEPDTGAILIEGRSNAVEPAHELRRRIGYVFQGVGLLPHLSVAENIAITPRLLHWPESDIHERVVELLTMVELPYETYARRLPATLSGGQRQRVGFARALAAKPEIVLMDEPFGALDPITRESLGQTYRCLHDVLGLTTIMVTHDIVEALLLTDRLGIMQNGSLVALGTPSYLLNQSTHPYVRDLMEAPRRQAARFTQKLNVETRQRSHG